MGSNIIVKWHVVDDSNNVVSSIMIIELRNCYPIVRNNRK